MILERINEGVMRQARPSTVLVGRVGTPGGGPYATATAWVRDGILLELAIDTNGCASAQKLAKGAVDLLSRRPLGSAALLDAKELIRYCQGVPEGKEFYAEIVLESVRALG